VSPHGPRLLAPGEIAHGEQAVVIMAADGIGHPVVARADGCLVTVGAVFWRADCSASYHF
jgi:hypothetical protein